MAKDQARFELNSSYAIFYLTADGALIGKIKTHFSLYRKENDTSSTKALDFTIYYANNEESTGANMACLMRSVRRGEAKFFCFYSWYGFH